MARLQILELPEGTDDDRPPFVLVIDQARTEDYYPNSDGKNAWQAYLDHLAMADPLKDMATRIGARAVLVFEDTIDIPANEITVGPDGYPLRVHIEGDFDQFREQVQDEIRKAQGELAKQLNGNA